MRYHEPIVPGVVACSDTVNVHAAFDNTEIGKISVSDEAHAEQALENAYQLFSNRAGWLNTEQRLAVLKKLADLMRDQDEQLATEAAREGGKPLIDSRVEVKRAIEGVELCAQALYQNKGEEIPMGLNSASSSKVAFTRREPIGVVIAVSAFNHPLNLIVHQVAPAIACGCPVIVKPATSTPLSCFSFVNMAIEAGVPDGWVQCLLPANTQVTEKLVTDPRVAFFSFIGSAQVGWMLRSKLAPGTRCALEHGGVAPVIVDKDPDLDTLIPKLSKGGFYHAGQVCVSVQRVFVHRSNADQVASALAASAEQLVVGDPNDENTQVGPLISESEVERVETWVKQAIKQGAKALCGGKKISDRLYPPTVLLDPPPDALVSTREVFGPVVCIYSYETPKQAITAANSLPFAFQASIFSKDIDFIMSAARHLDASAVMVNEHTAFRVDWMPFAGLKQSGHGVGGIMHTMHEMQIEKMVVIHSEQLSN